MWFYTAAFSMDTDVLDETPVLLVRLRCGGISISKSMNIPSRFRLRRSSPGAKGPVLPTGDLIIAC